MAYMTSQRPHHARYSWEQHSPMLHILLNFRIRELATNKTLSVEDGVFRVGVEGILGRVTDETFIIREGNPRGCDTMTLVVCDDFDTTTPLYTG